MIAVRERQLLFSDCTNWNAIISSILKAVLKKKISVLCAKKSEYCILYFTAKTFSIFKTCKCKDKHWHGEVSV